jgi:Domain of unknown function (DUF2017)
VIELSVSRGAGGVLSVHGIPPLLAQFLRELPGLLGKDQPDAVRRRLYPDPSLDAEIAAEWRRAQHPELFALIADSKRIVEADLVSLHRPKRKRTFSFEIAPAHVSAWISALNAGRLALGAVHEVTAADMDPEREPSYDDRGLAILRIDLYGWLQATLIEA